MFPKFDEWNIQFLPQETAMLCCNGQAHLLCYNREVRVSMVCCNDGGNVAVVVVSFHCNGERQAFAAIGVENFTWKIKDGNVLLNQEVVLFSIIGAGMVFLKWGVERLLYNEAWICCGDAGAAMLG